MKRFPGVAAALFLASTLLVRAADPMTCAELALRLRMGDGPQALLQETARRKLLEPPSPEQQAALKSAGAADAWLASLNAPELRASPEAAAAYRSRKAQRQAEAQATPTPTPVPAQMQLSQEKLHEADIVKVGDKAPAFTAKTADGKEIAVAQAGAKGRLTVVIIVALQSPVCDEELTFFEKQLWPRLAKAGVDLVALGSGAAPSDMSELGKRLDLHFPLAADPAKTITALYARDYAPRCYVIGKTGVVKYSSVGLNAADIQRLVNILESELR